MRTIRISFPVIIVAMIVYLASCNGKASSEQSTKIDTLWNDKVQNVFFDTPFGASKDEVIKNFAKHGFSVMKKISNDKTLHFAYNKSKYYSFGGMSWEMLNVSLTNGKFSYITFYNASRDKSDAISKYNSLVDEVSKKYKLTCVECEDSTVYGKVVVFSKSGNKAEVSCDRSESVNKNIFFYVSLSYCDTNLENEVSDEL